MFLSVNQKHSVSQPLQRFGKQNCGSQDLKIETHDSGLVFNETNTNTDLSFKCHNNKGGHCSANHHHLFSRLAFSLLSLLTAN